MRRDVPQLPAVICLNRLCVSIQRTHVTTYDDVALFVESRATISYRGRYLRNSAMLAMPFEWREHLNVATLGFSCVTQVSFMKLNRIVVLKMS